MRGSSYGVHKVEKKEDFEDACQDAFYYDGRGKILVEKAIEGFEIGCAVMGNETVFVAVSMRYRLPEASLILKASTKIKAPISSVRHGSMKTV